MKLSKGKKSIIQQLLVHGAVIAMVCLWLIGINRTSELELSGLTVHLDHIEDVKDLITEKEIDHLIREELPNDIFSMPIDKIDLGMIERLLKADTRLYSVEVYVDAQQQLSIDAIQRRPLFRVMNQQGDQYYVDQSGNYVQKGTYRAIRVPVITGYVESFSKDLILEEQPKLKKAFNIVAAVAKDKVLKALIEQIHFEKKGRVVLIPKIGEEKIIIDHLEDLDIKLMDLKKYYRHLAKTNGWNSFKEIDISYKKQVVGRNP